MNQHGEVKRGINPGDCIVVFSMFSRPCTPFFDLLQHRYKELWMEQQRALTAALRAEKKKVIVQQQFPLLCTALLPGTTPHCPAPPRMGFSQPWGGLSAGKTPSLTARRLVKPNKDQLLPSLDSPGFSQRMSCVVMLWEQTPDTQITMCVRESVLETEGKVWAFLNYFCT